MGPTDGTVQESFKDRGIYSLSHLLTVGIKISNLLEHLSILILLYADIRDLELRNVCIRLLVGIFLEKNIVVVIF